MREQRDMAERPGRKLDLRRLSAGPDSPDVSTVRLGGETGLHPVQRPVERLVLFTQRLKRTVEYVHDGRVGSYFKRGRRGCLRDEGEESRLDPPCTLVRPPSAT